MLLEARLRGLAPRMNVKLVIHKSINTPHQNPVLINWGSNGFYVDAQDLEDLIDLLSTDDEVSPADFLANYWEGFLRKHQSFL